MNSTFKVNLTVQGTVSFAARTTPFHPPFNLIHIIKKLWTSLYHLHEFWIPLGQILLVNIVLSGDNAVVIALAARSLPPKQQKLAIFWGSGAAILMRIVLTIFAVKLLTLPYLKLVGSVLLVWIGIQLLSADEGEENVSSSDNLAAAIKTILLADLVMSLDNVLGVAAAAKGSMPLSSSQHPLGDFWRLVALESHGTLSNHHHDRWWLVRLGSWRDGSDRPRRKRLA